MPADWTAEAQEAYKLLVECGRDLTNTPSPRSSPSVDQLDRFPPGLPPKFDQKPPPGRPPKTRNIPVMMNGRSLNYDNLNGVGAGRAAPPPVPPKPRMPTTRPSSMSPPPPATTNRFPLEKESPGFAPSITRGSLFSTAKKEEVIKF
ncbi:unnamed protein product [Nippostrongylus brasiliensis]|uniref:WH2 domain-containing protein n=1 Tax=Nippostrongylus brasiliensis TaxID=27835 RepID=A0A0N4Y8E9_NIPBR|nr:unnamed protein product [Nippostrongylus brasiliensis]